MSSQSRHSARTVRTALGVRVGSGRPHCVRSISTPSSRTTSSKRLFADTYGQLACRRGRNIATVAIARRLLARAPGMGITTGAGG